MKLPPLNARFSRLALIATMLYSAPSLAIPFYLSGYVGQSTLQDDNFFDQLSNEKDLNNTATSYAASIGIMPHQGLNIELEIGATTEFIAESTLSFSYEELSIENTFVRINLKHDFPLSDRFSWYIKEGAGIINVKQSFTNSTGTEKRNVDDNTLFLALSVGIQQEILFNYHVVNVYAEWQYSGYNLDNNNATYNLRSNTVGMGMQWMF